MKKNISFLFVFVASMMFPVTASAQVAAITDFCVLGAAQAVTSGLQSSNYQQELIPGCTVKVYSTGTTNLATIYADALETPLTNPFTAGTNGQWIFFAAINLGYDIVLSGGISPNIYPAPVTLTGLYPSSELSSTVWGGITGTLSNQTDLQNALNAKLNLSGGTMTGNLILPGITITSLTGYLYANGSSAVTASTTIPVAALTYDSIAVNSQTCTLGSSCTVTADTPNSLTFNNGGSGGASGSTFNGASALTVSYNTVGAAASNASTTVNGQTCTLGSSCTVTAAATKITVATTTISNGTSGYIEYDNSGVLGELATTGSGSVVQATSPSIAGLTVTSSFTATGLVTNADLAYDSTAVNSQTCTLGSSCTVTADTPNSLTFNNGGSGGASGSTFNGASALTVSYNTVGAAASNASTTVNGQTCTLGSSCTVTAAATSITVGTTTVSSGTTGYILYDNGGTLGDLATTGSGNVVQATSPSIAGLTVTSSFTATGLVTNADLAYDSTAVNGQTCTLGSSCTVTAAATSITVGTTTVSSGTTGYILYDNGGTLGDLATSGSGNVVLATSPSIAGLTVTSSFTATGLVTNADLAYDSTAVNSQTCTLGSSCTVTADTPNSLTFNNGGSGGASGSTFNGASALTVSYNTVGAAASNASTTVNGFTCTLGSSCTVSIMNHPFWFDDESDTVYTASQAVVYITSTLAQTIPSGGSSTELGIACTSEFTLKTAATASTTFNINDNGTGFGTIVFGASGTSGTITISSAKSIASGDVITVTGPSTADSTAAGLYGGLCSYY